MVGTTHEEGFFIVGHEERIQGVPEIYIVRCSVVLGDMCWGGVTLRHSL
jgi:hypothetical protein